MRRRRHSLPGHPESPRPLRAAAIGAFVFATALAVVPRPAGATSNMNSDWRDIYYSGSGSFCSQCHTGSSFGGSDLGRYGSDFVSALAQRNSSYSCSLSGGNYPCITNDNPGLNNGNVIGAIRDIEQFFAPNLVSIEISEQRPGQSATTQSFSPSSAPGTLPQYASSITLVFGAADRFNAVGDDTINSSRACTSGSGCQGVASTNLNVGNDARTNAVRFDLPPLGDRAGDRRGGVTYRASAEARNRHFTAADSAAFATQNIGPTVAGNCSNGIVRLVSAVENVPGGTVTIDVDATCSPIDPDDSAASLDYASPDSSSVSYGSVAQSGATGFRFTLPDTLSEEQETVSFTVTIEDSDGAQATVPVVINVPPAAPTEFDFVANDDFFIIDEDTGLTGENVADINGTADNPGAADDLDGAAPSSVEYIFGAPTSGDLTASDDGTFSFTPATDFFGDVTFTYTLTDGTSFDEATVTITVLPVNDLPQADPIAATAFDIDDPFIVDLLTNPDPDLSIFDPDGDALTVSNVSVEVLPASLGANPQDAASVEGAIATISPLALERLNVGETGQIIVSYDITDGPGNTPVGNTLVVTVEGSSNAVIRQPGAYADTLSSRYTTQKWGGHFGTQEDANASCHACHVPGQVDVLAPTCGTGFFNAYGDALCFARDPGEPPLTDLVRRLGEAEADFAPRLSRPAPVRIPQSAGSGSSVGAPVTAADPGRNVFGERSEIVDYLFAVEGGAPTAVDPTGNFAIDPSGQVRVVSGGIEPGVYELTIVPVNDAGRQDNEGIRLPAGPGFFPTVTGPESVLVVSVEAEEPVAADDSFAVIAGETAVLDVRANDNGGGPADSIVIVSEPSLGSASVGSDNTITYVAGPADGTDVLSYRAVNAAGQSEEATVTIEVIPGDALFARDDTAQVIAGQTAQIAVLANDRNVVTSGPTPTVVEIVDAPDTALGTTSVSGQQIQFAAAAGINATAQIVYRATNNDGETATATVSLDIVAFGAGLLAEAVSDPKLREVARVVDESCALLGDPGTLSAEAASLRGHCVTLTAAAANGEALDRAMAAIRNEEHLATVDATSAAARGLGNAIGTRIEQIRLGGGRGIDLGGVAVTMGDTALPGGFLQQLAAGLSGLDELSARASSSSGPEPEWGLFIAGDISYTEADEGGRQEDYELNIGSLIIGADYQYDPFTTFGFALGYASGETEFGDGSELDSESYQASFYGVRYSPRVQGLSYQGYLSFGRMEFDSTRKIAYDLSTASVDATAEASFGGQYVNLAPRVSFSQELAAQDGNGPAPVVTWSTGLDYLWLETEDYTETGGDGFALDVESEEYRSLLADVSVDFRTPLVVRNGYLAELVGGLTIGAELLDEDRSVTSSLAAAGPNAPRFTATEAGRQGVRGDAEIGIVTASRAGNLDLRYGYGTDETGYSSQRLSLQFSRTILGNDSLNVGVTRQLGDTDGMPVNLDYQLNF